MAFTTFKTVDDLITRYGVRCERVEFVRPVAGVGLSPATREVLAFNVANVAYERSEVAAREAVIYPVLRDVWMHYYHDRLTLLSGEPLTADADLCGEVDYMVCRRSPLGPFMPDRPLLLVGGAKRDDATVGWNQALGGMLAARRLSGPDFTYYGLTTTGSVWRFGTLAGNRFTIDMRPFGLSDLDALAGALHFVFAACRDQVDALPPAPAAP